MGRRNAATDTEQRNSLTVIKEGYFIAKGEWNSRTTLAKKRQTTSELFRIRIHYLEAKY